MLQNEKNHNFLDVFPQLHVDAPIKEMLKDAKIKKINVYKEDKAIEILLDVKNIIYREILEQLSRQIQKQFKGINKVYLKSKYISDDDLLNNKDSKSKVIHLYWDSILHSINDKHPIGTGILKDCHWKLKDNYLVLKVSNNQSSYLRKNELDKKIKWMLNEELGLNMEVVFEEEMITKDKKKIYEDNLSNIEHDIVENLLATSTTQVINTEEVKDHMPDKETPDPVILGKDINSEAIRIKDITEESDEVVIQGDILSIEYREINHSKYIVTFDITDYEDSITVKFFVKKNIFENAIKNRLKEKCHVWVKGLIQYDNFSKEIVLMAKDIVEKTSKLIRIDQAQEKRIELHAHTQMSSMDGIVSVTALIERAAKWGHPAIAITDHGVVQAYPDAASASKKYGIKVIYGIEAYLVDDLNAVIQNPQNQTLEDEYTVFDIETTGLSPTKDKITEIGAIKIKNGKIIDYFSCFVNPEMPIPANIQELTGITDEMVKDAATIEHVLPDFLKFIGDSVLVAHNANFDVSFIRTAAENMSLSVQNTVLDTLELSRLLFPSLSRHKLDIVAKHLGVSLENHHRAVDDAKATAEIFIKCIDILKEKNIQNLNEINALAGAEIDVKKLKTYHAVILVKNQTGLINLYKLVSFSHLEYFNKRPRIPKSLYLKYKEGLMIGTACEAGELYRAILNKKSDEEIKRIASFYDYLEIQPLDNNQFLIDNGTVESVDELKKINMNIVELGTLLNKPVVATCDVHFLDPQDEVFRRIIMAGQGFSDADNQAPLYLRTTEEMLEEFSYLGEKKAREVVIDNPNKINQFIENIKPIPDETFPPKIEGAEEELTRITMEKAKSIYGDPLPPAVQNRLDRELNAIIKNGFAVMYIIAQKLVWKSLEDGYLVGSRGSVGSSFVATMASITEVNPLPPHYICPNCKYSDFDSEMVKSFAGGSGCDMPDKICPKCGEMMNKDGHDIPFETFLGFDGDKEPDIDLNFSGEYQPRAHSYTEELFGKDYVYRAGTIGTLAEKTAYGFVKKYMESKNIVLRKAEVNRLVKGCTGIKRTTGQHPGGLMIVPKDKEIYEFCPVQRPANDVNSPVITTHFDYHSISGRLLKLDILGHDDPTVIRMLEDLTGVNPRKIPLDDENTMSLFSSTKALNVSPEQINCEVGTLGLPEFGTKFVRQMLIDTKPKTFSELIRISGLSHGTDVWLNNAQDLIRDGTASLSEVICTRDDIMVYLINKGVEKKHAFKIMEKVRKGKGLEPDDEEAMKAAGVPQWYIDSCKKIKYMFPKAHAAAYVMMAFRIAHFKVYYPEAFYATYFTVRAEDFDYCLMCKGENKVRKAIKEYEEKGNNLTTKEKGTLTVLEIVLEMYARGFKFIPIDLYKSDAVTFKLTPEGILPPLNALQGLGNTAAFNIVKAREEGEFLSVEDFVERAKISRPVVEIMRENEILTGIPESSQLSLF